MRPSCLESASSYEQVINFGFESDTEDFGTYMLRMKLKLRVRGLIRIKLYPDILVRFSQIKETH